MVRGDPGWPSPEGWMTLKDKNWYLFLHFGIFILSFVCRYLVWSGGSPGWLTPIYKTNLTPRLSVHCRACKAAHFCDFCPFKDFQAWKNRSGCYGLTRNRDSPTYHCSWNLQFKIVCWLWAFFISFFFISDQSINTQWCLTSFLMMPDIRFLIMFWKHFLNFTDILSLKHIIS